jgi:5'-3' exonuclease
VTQLTLARLDRRRGILRDEAAVEAKFGVKPQSIPDYLAVLGDSADEISRYTWLGRKSCSRDFASL